jgi:adenosine kinase
MSALICGSYAFDNIMVFPDRFKNHILPDQVHILNVCFLVPEMRREFGGCAGNIAYNLKLLGGEPRPMATVGTDFAPYAQWLDDCGIDRSHVKVIDDSFTAQAFITTDLDDNQITAFHPGAMNFAHQNRVGDASGITLGLLSPDGRQAMLDHAEQFAAAGTPFIFDPGQGLPMFNGEELLRFVEWADWAALNDYEARMLSDRTGLDYAALSQRLRGLVITLAEQGCEVWQAGQCVRVPGVAAASVIDPTGCGDAFRAALLFGLDQGWPLERCVALGNRMGAAKIATRGGQNYRFDLQHA